MLTSGPQARIETDRDEFNSHPNTVLRSMRVFIQDKNLGLLQSLEFFLRLNPMTAALWEDILIRNDWMVKSFRPKSKYLGALAIKEEAAGKVRVFAMVDPWTQWVLKPLHILLFECLRKLPTDGTFNQMGPIARVPFGKVPIYSFDLSAATDRLPLDVQQNILRKIFSDEFAQHWANLLVGRSYKTPSESQLDEFGIKYPTPYPTSVRYEVGQPMGALSSWAMLATTHHFIVQVCAWSTGICSRKQFFTEYAVLGDDIVIWNKTVADQYLKILKSLGVETNLAKSILSPKGLGLEFAKRTLIKGEDCSPIPFKEQAAAHVNMGNLLCFMSKYSLSILQVLRFLGYGYKVHPEKDTKLLKSIRLAMLIPSTAEQLRDLFSVERPYLELGEGLNLPKAEVTKNLVLLIDRELTSLLGRVKKILYLLLSTEPKWYLDSIGPSANSVSIIRREVLSQRMRDYIKDLQILIDQLNFAIETNRSPKDQVTHFVWGTGFNPWLLSKSNSKDLFHSIDILFNVEDSFSRLQLDLFKIHKNVRLNLSPPLMEEKRVLLLWNKWARSLAKIGYKLF